MLKWKRNQNIQESESQKILTVPKYQPKYNVLTIATKEEALNEILYSQFRLQKLLVFEIRETFKPFNKEEFAKLKSALEVYQIFAFQSNINGKFCIIWKKEGFYSVSLFDEIKKENLQELCLFIVNFIAQCLEENCSGISSDDNENDQLNLTLASLSDQNGYNLFFNAAKCGNANIIKILLQVAFHVNMMHNELLAIDVAYENKNFEVVLELLKNNSMFPKNLKINQCSNDVKEFIKMSQNFHKNIRTGNIDELKRILNQNLKLRYFYNLDNQSALAAAIYSKKFDVYELLMERNLCFSMYEDIDEIGAYFNKQRRKELPEQHINVLMSRSFVGDNFFDMQEKFDLVLRAFQWLDNIYWVHILLKVAALLTDLHIIFDFNRNSIQCHDPTTNRCTHGYFYGNNRIYIGVRELFHSETEDEVFASIAHELCHFVLYNIFGSHAKPYEENIEFMNKRFEAIIKECRDKKYVSKLISEVFDYYPEEMYPAELIARVPHLFAYYYVKKSKIMFKISREFPLLFEFYDYGVIAIHENLIYDLKIKAKDKIKSENKNNSFLYKICFKK